MAEFEFELDLDELLAELAADDSWEPDAEVRQGVIFGLRMAIVGM